MSCKVVDRDTYVALIRSLDDTYTDRVTHSYNRSIMFTLDASGRAVASASYVRIGNGEPCQITYRVRA